MEDKELEQIIKNAMKKDMDAQFMRGINAGWIAACVEINEEIKDMHNAKNIHRVIAKKCREAKERIGRS